MADKKSIFNISEEDMNLSFEGITQVEKRFINIVRKYRSQIWLQQQVETMFEETLTDAIDTSITHVALSSFMDEVKEDLKVEDAFNVFHDIKDAIVDDPNLMEEMTEDWGKLITETVLGELVPLDEEEVKHYIERVDK